MNDLIVPQSNLGSQYLTITKAAKEYGIERHTLYQWILAEKLPAEKRQSAGIDMPYYVIKRDDLVKFLSVDVHRIFRNVPSANPGAINQAKTNVQRRRAKKKKLPATFTMEDWGRCLEYFDYKCAVCGRPAGLWHTIAQDHWVPFSKKGGYTKFNIVPLCHGIDGCNNQKSNTDPLWWLAQKYGSRKAQRIIKLIQAYFDSLKGQSK